jgi:hypothetical protein
MRGRKVDTVKQEKFDTIFINSVDRTQFEDEAQREGISKKTATVYWYKLCKANGRLVNEKRGRKPVIKTDLGHKMATIESFVNSEIEKAKNAKKSTLVLCQILNLIVGE